MPNLFQENMKAEKECLDEMMEFFVEFGKPRHLPRKKIVEAYRECLNKLGNHYASVSDAIKALYKAIPEHSAFPRYNARVPMAFREARDYEASMGNGGIVTGFNQFQGWANKHKDCNSKSFSNEGETQLKLTDKIIENFIHQMQEKYPLDVNVQITYNLQHGIIVRGEQTLRGIAIRKADTGEVHININTDQHDILVLKTIAHEYRHVMQWMNAEMEWMTLSSKKTDKEIDAHLFGNKLVREYYKFP